MCGGCSRGLVTEFGSRISFGYMPGRKLGLAGFVPTPELELYSSAEPPWYVEQPATTRAADADRIITSTFITSIAKSKRAKNVPME